MKKKTICTEFCYLAGVIILALGTALMEKAGFGMSMVVAPAYLIYLKLSQVLPFSPSAWRGIPSRPFC